MTIRRPMPILDIPQIGWNLFEISKKIKEKSRLRKRDKEEVKNMAVEQGKREVANEVYSRFYQQELRNNHVPEPSAPPPYYPDLKQFQKL